MPLSILTIGPCFVRLWRWLSRLAQKARYQSASAQPRRTADQVAYGEPEANGRLSSVATKRPLRFVVYTTSALDVLGVVRELAGTSLLLDITTASRVGVPFLRRLASDWPSQVGGPIRLGIRMTFERWARLRLASAPFLVELAEKGVEAMLFYDQQSFAPWFEDGRVVHNAEGVISYLERTQEYAVAWPRLVEAAATLISDEPRATRPALLAALAEIALLRGVPQHALDLATEAVDSLHDDRSNSTECKALRVLGEAMFSLRQDRAAELTLRDAVSLAIALDEATEAASAAFVLGLIALSARDSELASHWFHQAALSAGPESTDLSRRIRTCSDLVTRPPGIVVEEATQLDNAAIRRAGRVSN